MNFNITFSTWLTLSRILLTPCVIAAIYYDAWLLALILFTIAAATDFFDGYCARLYHQESQLGKLLDPVADKILIFSTLCALYGASDRSLLPLWFIILVAVKEVVLLLGGIFLLVQKKSFEISPSWFAKCVTALFMAFLVYVMLICWGVLPACWIDQFIQFFAVSTILILFDYSSQFGMKL